MKPELVALKKLVFVLMVEELIRNLSLKVEFLGFKEFLKRKLKAEFTPLLYGFSFTRSQRG